MKIGPFDVSVSPIKQLERDAQSLLANAKNTVVSAADELNAPASNVAPASSEHFHA